MNPDDYEWTDTLPPDTVRMLARYAQVGTAVAPMDDGVRSYLALAFEGHGADGQPLSFVAHLPVQHAAEWMAGVAKVLADLDPNSFTVREVTEAEADGLREGIDNGRRT